MTACVFCNIIAGDFNTELLGETEHSIAFRDINPEQKVHLLVAPKNHYRDIVELSQASETQLLDLISLGIKIATEHSDGSFQFKFNTGAEAGQTVFHVHGHILSNQPKSN